MNYYRYVKINWFLNWYILQFDNVTLYILLSTSEEKQIAVKYNIVI